MSRETSARYPVTPDGRYFVVRGRLWRRADPDLPEAERARLVGELMTARRAVQTALRSGAGLAAARRRVDAAKVALGERGPPWWTDGAPDYNRRMAANTPYAAWFAGLQAAPRTTGTRSSRRPTAARSRRRTAPG